MVFKTERVKPHVFRAIYPFGFMCYMARLVVVSICFLGGGAVIESWPHRLYHCSQLIVFV